MYFNNVLNGKKSNGKGKWGEAWFETCNGWFMQKDFAKPLPALYVSDPRHSETDPLIVFKDNKEANAFYYNFIQTEKIFFFEYYDLFVYYDLHDTIKKYVAYKKSIGEEINTKGNLYGLYK